MKIVMLHHHLSGDLRPAGFRLPKAPATQPPEHHQGGRRPEKDGAGVVPFASGTDRCCGGRRCGFADSEGHADLLRMSLMASTTPSTSRSFMSGNSGNEQIRSEFHSVLGSIPRRQPIVSV